jgi:hypothetical protein
MVVVNFIVVLLLFSKRYGLLRSSFFLKFFLNKGMNLHQKEKSTQGIPLDFYKPEGDALRFEN